MRKRCRGLRLPAGGGAAPKVVGPSGGCSNWGHVLVLRLRRPRDTSGAAAPRRLEVASQRGFEFENGVIGILQELPVGDEGTMEE